MDKKMSKKKVKESIQIRLSALLKLLSEGMYEREHILAIALLGTIAGQNTFLLGPPGTAKSLISRRLALAFYSQNYFECLMNRFSTPEEIFGPVSIKALKKDCYIRQIDGYLPTADFAFLDEIWKASPAILNNLLTIVNEHLFKNGHESIQVPLKALIAASNEIPLENQGLEALYDRFILRLFVPPIQEERNFELLLTNGPTATLPEIDSSLQITEQELIQWRKELASIKLSQETIDIIKIIRRELLLKQDEYKIYVSDRRWQRAAMLLKASAFCHDRQETNLSEILLLKYCLWSTSDNFSQVDEIIKGSIKEYLTNVDKLKKEKKLFEKNLEKELFYNQDIYGEVSIGNERCFKIEATFSSDFYKPHKQTLYIPVKKFKSVEKFNPLDSFGNPLQDIEVDFYGGESCNIYYYDYYNRYKHARFTPKPIIRKGERKQNIETEVIHDLVNKSRIIKDKFNQFLEALQDSCDKKRLTNMFVAYNDLSDLSQVLTQEIDKIKLELIDCERLESLCK